MKCRLCYSDHLSIFLDLGLHPPSDQFKHEIELNEQTFFYPLKVAQCDSCGFVQLTYVVPPEILYQKNYPYESSTTKTGRIHYFDFANSIIYEFNLTKDDLVVDIGSNVGVLLEGFQKEGVRIQGVDPAPNIAKIANSRGIPTINSFFNQKVSSEILKSMGMASIITGTNVFAHVDDLHAFMIAIKTLLDPEKGVFVIEAPHFLHLIANLEYDTIYHEHLSYISIEPLILFFSKFDMQIIKVEEKDIHGGSIRIFISRVGNYNVDSSVQDIVNKEKSARLRDISTLKDFSVRVQKNKLKLMSLLLKLKNEGHKIAAVSAPAKGMTLLNYCNIDSDIIDFVTEKSSLKIGLFTPGGNIPVFGDEKLMLEKPNYVILLAWNFSKEIIENNRAFTESGGHFIIPIPEPKII